MRSFVILFVFCLIFSANLALAEPTLKLGGSIDSQLGGVTPSGRYYFDNPQGDLTTFPRNYLNQIAVVNDTRFGAKFETMMEQGAELGAVIILNADTSLPKFNNTTKKYPGFESFAFMESNVGRIEVGNTTGVYKALRVSGATLARATGGIDGDVKYRWHPYIYKDGTFVKDNTDKQYTTNASPDRLVKTNFIYSPNLPSNYYEGTEANAAKINYISPDFEGFRLGLSYIKDIEQFGTASTFRVVTIPGPTYGSDLLGFLEIYSGIMKYEKTFNGTSVLVSLAGEIGKAKSIKFGNTITPTAYFKRHRLKAWEVGAGLEDSGFKLAGSYGDWGLSGTFERLTNSGCKKSNFWTAGGAFENNDFGISVTYFLSNRCGLDSRVAYDFETDGANAVYRLKLGTVALPKAKQLEIWSVGLDGKPAPGFVPYSELSFYRINENNGLPTSAQDPTSFSSAKSAAHNNKNIGTVFLSGVKILF